MVGGLLSGALGSLLGGPVGCRSDLTATQVLSCGPGVRVVVASSPLCVYAPGIEVETCPDPVPARNADAEGWTYCAVEEDLPAVVLGAARSAAQDVMYQDAGPPDALLGQEGAGGGLGGSGGGPDQAPDFSQPRDQGVFDGATQGPDAGPLPDF